MELVFLSPVYSVWQVAHGENYQFPWVLTHADCSYHYTNTHKKFTLVYGHHTICYNCEYSNVKRQRLFFLFCLSNRAQMVLATRRPLVMGDPHAKHIITLFTLFWKVLWVVASAYCCHFQIFETQISTSFVAPTVGSQNIRIYHKQLI